jgi:hypothetical protein
MRKALEQVQQYSNPTDEEMKVLEKGLSKFSIRVFNRNAACPSTEKLVVFRLLVHFYSRLHTPTRELYRVNLHYLRRRLQTIIRPSEDDDTDAEQVAIRPTEKMPVSTLLLERFGFEGFMFYEYVRLVRKRPARNLPR